MTEADWLDQLVGTARDHEGIAIRFGWHVLHIRPARTQHSWRTPIQGDMGKGWPDLILLRTPRLLAIECKSDKGKLTPEQMTVLALLQTCGVETYIWRPSDIEEAVRVLR